MPIPLPPSGPPVVGGDNPCWDAIDMRADPNTVTFIVRDPLGGEHIYEYGSSPQVVRDGLGSYQLNLVPQEPGLWQWEVVSTGDPTTTTSGTFSVLPTNLL